MTHNFNFIVVQKVNAVVFGASFVPKEMDTKLLGSLTYWEV